MLQYKSNLKKLLIASILFPALTGCHDFSDLNQDLYNPPYVEGQEQPDPDPEPEPEGKYADLNINYKISDEDIQQLKEGQANAGTIFSSLTYEGCYNDYQITTNLTHDMYSGYIANNNPNFRFNSPNYAYTDGWSAKRWDHFYADRTVREYSHLLKTFKFVDYEKYKNAFYITRIYWAFLASMQTDTYGDIPLSAYVQAKVVEGDVPYDTQEKAYDIIFRLLEQAVDSIVPNACVFKFNPADDKCYSGDEEK